MKRCSAFSAEKTHICGDIIEDKDALHVGPVVMLWKQIGEQHCDDQRPK